MPNVSLLRTSLLGAWLSYRIWNSGFIRADPGLAEPEVNTGQCQ
jgi:hypothetical protein